MNFLGRFKTKLKIKYPFLSKELRTTIECMETVKTDWNTIELADYSEMRKSAWFQLGSLAYEIVKENRPKTIVELGSHMGYSALVMALSLKKNNIPGKIYAIDTWVGDPHAGYYGEEVYTTLKHRIVSLGLSDHIELVRDTFENAKTQFKSIDILHIDGLHTYKAAFGDFNCYKECLHKGSLVLFHDVNTYFKEMRQLWRQISWKYESCMVPYSHGLGIIRIN
jgi:predicted O-methyltransferase YrrM